MERGGRIETAASVRKLSDHSPLVMTVWGNQPPPENPPHYFDISLLAEEELRKEMVAAWKGDQESPPINQGWPAWLEAAIQHVTSCNARLAKDKRRVQGKHARTQAKKVQLAEIELQNDPANVEDLFRLPQGRQKESPDQRARNEIRNRNRSKGSYRSHHRLLQTRLHFRSWERRFGERQGAMLAQRPALGIGGHERAPHPGALHLRDPQSYQRSPERENARPRWLANGILPRMRKGSSPGPA
ncbi:unnamed protein product [Sphagnum jensenii]